MYKASWFLNRVNRLAAGWLLAAVLDAPAGLITGTVVDLDDRPLAGVSIFLDGGSDTVLSGDDGSFSLAAGMVVKGFPPRPGSWVCRRTGTNLDVTLPVPGRLCAVLAGLEGKRSKPFVNAVLPAGEYTLRQATLRSGSSRPVLQILKLEFGGETRFFILPPSTGAAPVENDGPLRKRAAEAAENLAILKTGYLSAWIPLSNLDDRELGSIRLAADSTLAPVTAAKDADGGWNLLVGGNPYFIKGAVYMPVKIGEDPAGATQRNWMDYDDDGDGINDPAFQSFRDANRNNSWDSDEPREGDFSLLRKMGANTLRFYYLSSQHPVVDGLYRMDANMQTQFDRPLDKELLRRMYREQGLRAMIGNYMGAFTIGTGGLWAEGCDYANPVHRANILRTVKAMVLDSKDEPYTLMWVLGNENNIANWANTNAASEPVAYATLLQEAAAWIHAADPHHPVAVCDGDDGGANLSVYAVHAPAINAIGYNAYPGNDGFSRIWNAAKSAFDRPVFITEWGMFAFQDGQENDSLQEAWVRTQWKDIVENSAGRKPGGNAVGGTIFDWLDRWYIDGSPSTHNAGVDSYWHPTPDGLFHEEWFGVAGMGDGSDWNLRQTRSVYDYFADVWNRDTTAF